MNLKKIICLAVVASVTSQVSAMEIYKGKVISEKIWSNDGSKAILAHNNHDQTRHANGDIYEYVQSSIQSNTAKVNDRTMLNNAGYISLFNTSDESIEYEISQSICSQTSEAMNRCVYSHTVIQLEPTGSLSNNSFPQMEMTYSKPGHYRITASTSLYHSGTNPHTSSSVATIVAS